MVERLVPLVSNVSQMSCPFVRLCTTANVVSMSVNVVSALLEASSVLLGSKCLVVSGCKFRRLL